MSSLTPSTNRCSRTYWTQTMERYFVDLMLEHIHRGNRIGHTFNKQAWIDMLDVFNAKFGSQYDKDVLKSRYTNLWRLFNDIKHLLGENGFSWDETRQMVVADDYTWDAYIKIHPEARPFRTKSVLNFDDLCLIYGYTVADGRYSRSSHDVDVEDEMLELNFGDCNNSLTPSSTARTEWTPDMDQYFVDLMLKQQERGSKFGDTFTKQAWTEMLALFNAKFSSDYNKRVLRHRYKKLWKYFSDLVTLANQKGFSWDEKQEMVVANDDVWDAYIKAHPHARLYRARVFPSYKNLALIFGNMINKDSPSERLQDSKSEAAVVKAGERSRTYWTPPMDRFLIDLMLEQVHRGNRIGQSFITQAWNDMVESFNSNFNACHDKEVLKNRYKHFRKQYNDVSIILQNNGFKWDRDREMVTAEDHVWDAYITAHPDGKSYRVKTVPCYHKLCVIYGQDKFDGSYSHLLGGTDPTTGTSGNQKEEARDGDADPIIDWTLPMERYFVDLMLEQVHHGKKINRTFDERDWAHMTLLFKEKFGPQYEQHILENHYLIFMNRYIEISNLLDQEGFVWDEASHMIIADDDTWESYAKEHPEAISYKDKVIEHYDDLWTIFGTHLVDTKLSCDVPMEMDHPIDIKVDEYSGELPVTFLETKIYDRARKRPPPTPTALEPCKKAQKAGDGKDQGEFTNVFSRLVNMEAGNNYFAIESAIEALQAIPDIDDELLLDSCDLFEDERKAKTFLALDASLRKKWLLRKLGRS